MTGLYFALFFLGVFFGTRRRIIPMAKATLDFQCGMGSFTPSSVILYDTRFKRDLESVEELNRNSILQKILIDAFCGLASKL
jgi:hypothetical protein